MVAVAIIVISNSSLAQTVTATQPEQPTPPQIPSLPNTKPLETAADIASEMVAGIDRFLLRELAKSKDRRAAAWQDALSSTQQFDSSLPIFQQRLATILGVRDERIASDGLKTFNGQPPIAWSDHFLAYSVQWPAINGIAGEGVWLKPLRTRIGFVIAVPDADQTPEQVCGLQDGIPLESQFARRLAEQGYEVLVPALISRRRKVDIFLRSPDVTARELIYRSAFEVGRHIIGYELQKILAAVDVMAKQTDEKMQLGIMGYGEGGMLALYAAALDPRIQTTVVSGYVDDRAATMYQQPISRNVFGLLEVFGDAQLCAMISPRKLIIEASAHPDIRLPTGTDGAPAKIETPAALVVQNEIESARRHSPHQDWVELIESDEPGFGWDSTIRSFDAAMRGAKPRKKLQSTSHLRTVSKRQDEQSRLHRMMREMDQFTQRVLVDSQQVRRQFFEDLDTRSPEAFTTSVQPYRDHFRKNVIGHYANRLLPANAHTRQLKQSEKVTYYEVTLDVFPDVMAYGILCLPRDIQPDERRPVVVCQHGLEGRPQSTIGEKDFHYYQAFATTLAERGFVTFAPQNPYIFEDRFRSLQRKSYPIQKTLFSIIVPQHQQIVDWLQTQSFVDPARIALYGLSYGGKTAMRVPPLVKDYCLSICSADFNEWVDKNASTRNPKSYVWSGEYEIFEWDLGSTFNYAEMATLIAPRPFMVERGHSDGVADDWTVGWEFAKVRNLYAHRLKIPESCEIEWFDGPHTINGKGTFQFLHKHLNWPEPQ
jgi:dienelactone hydrolase